MNWLMPEPASDICAQIEALLTGGHPKGAVFAAPGNKDDLAGRGLTGLIMPWGTLLSWDVKAMDMFEHAMPDDAAMARILGYPEPKDAAIAACPAAWLRVVQACNWRGNVITEALCSPAWLDRTREALALHGHLRVLTVDGALARRLAFRCAEAMSG
jgi:hypothetical protein